MMLLFQYQKRVILKSTSKFLYIIFTFLSLVLISSLSLGFYYRFWFQGLDSSGFVELVNRSFKEKSLNSNAFASAVDYVKLVWNSNYNCYRISNYQLNPNILSIHTYTISYLLSFISQVFPFSNLTFVSILFGINFAIPLIFGIFGFLKIRDFKLNREKLSFVLMLILLIVTVTIWPPFLIGMQGQFYFDRLTISLFFILGFLLPKLDTINNFKKIFFLICLFLSPLISERSTLVSLLICFMALYVLFQKKKNNEIYIRILILHLIIFSTYYLAWKIFFSDPTLNTIPNIDSILTRMLFLMSNFESSGLLTFALMITPLLLVNFFSRINFVLSLFLILPNLIFNVGGAELTGFSTHYHSLYIGFIIAGLFNSLYRIFIIPNNKLSKIVYVFLILFSISLSLKYYNSW